MPELSPWIPGESWHIPNLALCNVAANTAGAHDIRIFDLNRRRGSVRRAVARILARFQPDLLGLSAMTFMYESARAIAWQARRQRPEVVTVLGGYHASMMYREIAASRDRELFDWLVRGEGDRSIGEILETMQGRRDPTTVLGASWRDGERTVHNPDRPLADLSELALPARRRRAYFGARQGLAPADVMETSRGCTLACSFCSINTMYGRSHRVFPIDWVLGDLRQMSRMLAREVFCADDNITNDPDRFEALCDAMIANRRKLLVDISITTQATCAGIARSQRLVDKMARAGFVKVFLGIENVSRQTLREINKGDIVELTRTAVRRLRGAGIASVGGGIIGFPHDGEQEIRDNFEFFRSLGVDHTIAQIFTPYPGTSSREQAIAGGYVTNRYDLRWYNGFWANVRTDRLASAELEYLRWKIGREVIGPFHASPLWLRHYPVTGRVWNRGFLPLYRLADRSLTRLLGERRRFQLTMDRLRRKDAFDLEPPPFPFAVDTLPPEPRRGVVRGIQRNAAHR
jgi:radical SAM superfamily enzyme YgiQ (UPF0313 family)